MSPDPDIEEPEMTTREGGCQCGQVRYTLKSEPVVTLLCHCTHCQRLSGSVFSTNVGVPEAAYEQRGETKVFVDKGDSGQAVWRHFCPNCGSQILSKLGAAPGLVVIKVGTLDNLSGLKPAIELYTDHSAAWVVPVAGARRFAQAAN
jgi:hypothetical protein